MIWQSHNARLLPRKKQRQQVIMRKALRVPIVLGAVLAIVSAATLWHVMSQIRDLTASDNLPAILLNDGQDIRYDVATLPPQQTRFFAYPGDSPQLMMQRDSKGTVRVAFATCTQCYSYRGKHQLRAGELICARCQHSMRLGDSGEQMTKDKGCVAVPVPFSIQEHQLLVKSQVITEGAAELKKSAAGNR